MALKPVSTSDRLSVFALNDLFTRNFTAKSIQDLCKMNSVPQNEGHGRISVLLLDILGDANQKMQAIIPKMADPAFQAAFRARCVRHIVYVEGWKDNISPINILKDQDVNRWYQQLTFDTSCNPDERVLEERLQTFRFLSEPQEAWLWKGGCVAAQQLHRKRIELRLQLYAFTNTDSCDLNKENALSLSRLIYKDIALYAGGIALTWIEALQDWVQLCQINKKHVADLLQILPLKIFFQKNGSFFLPEGIIGALKVFLKEHSSLSFQKFIAFSTLCALEQSLQLPNCSLDRTVWMAKCTASEHLRARLAFFSCHKIALLPKEPSTVFTADESDLLSFYLLTCLDAEWGFTIKSKEKKGDKKISVDSTISEQAELRLYLLDLLLARDKTWDKTMVAYFSCPPQIFKAAMQKKQLEAREKVEHLKQSELLPQEYACIVYLMCCKDEERIAPLLSLFTELAKSTSFPLTKDQVKRDLRLFLEKKEDAIAYLKYLHCYEELMGKTLTPSTAVRLRWEDLPPTLNREPRQETLKSYSVYLSSEYCASLDELQKIHVWFKWIVDEPAPAQFASISSTISALTQYLGCAPSSDLYFLLRNLRGCKTQMEHLQDLMSLRQGFIEAREQCIFRPRLIKLWETALNTKTVFLENPLFLAPDLQEQLDPFNASLQKNLYKVTFLPLQLITDCFYIEGIAENTITYPDAEVFYNHGGQLKEILPSVFVSVNWEPYAGSSPLMLSLFFLNARAKQGSWLFHPLDISPSIDPFLQRSFFAHLRELAIIFLSEKGAKRSLKKSRDITLEDVCKSYPQAKTLLLALDQIKSVDIALKFLTRLKIQTRTAWWETLSIDSSEKERKVKESVPSSSTELSEDVIVRARTAIQQQEKDKDLAKINMGEGAEASLCLSSTRSTKIDGTCSVSLSFACEKHRGTLAALDYPSSFLKDDAAFALLFSKHVLGLKLKYRREKD